jgi:aminodeoxyfutalosine deaminase
VFGIDTAGLADLARAAVRTSYASEETKRRLLSDIDAYA